MSSENSADGPARPAHQWVGVVANGTGKVSPMDPILLEVRDVDLVNVAPGQRTLVGFVLHVYPCDN